jgi:hypothetical protein
MPLHFPPDNGTVVILYVQLAVGIVQRFADYPILHL